MACEVSGTSNVVTGMGTAGWVYVKTKMQLIPTGGRKGCQGRTGIVPTTCGHKLPTPTHTGSLIPQINMGTYNFKHTTKTRVLLTEDAKLARSLFRVDDGECAQHALDAHNGFVGFVRAGHRQLQVVAHEEFGRHVLQLQRRQLWGNGNRRCRKLILAYLFPKVMYVLYA